MLLTNGKMLESLGVLANIEESGKLGYACARNRRKLLTECREFMDKRDELLRKYGSDKYYRTCNCSNDDGDYLGCNLL